jgi:hypothetical protein
VDTNTPNRGEDLLDQQATSNTKVISTMQTGSKQNTETSSVTNREQQLHHSTSFFPTSRLLLILDGKWGRRSIVAALKIQLKVCHFSFLQ